MSADAGIHVLALTGIPEIVEGDDLAARIGDAIEGTAGAAPLTDQDVLVVTQKVVSKAEGAVVDLTGIEPRPEAVTFAERWDRDPRQVEVVLREAKRVVRMANGVVITETAHGFICANGGIDASNVGPASGSIVTLLPVDPDASATAIRTRIRERFGLDVPVIVSGAVHEARDGQLEERVAPKQGQERLGAFGPAEGVQPGPTAAGQDDGVHVPLIVAGRPSAVCAQKLGGVTQNSTVAGSSPRLTFQCGRRDGNVIASPSRST